MDKNYIKNLSNQIWTTRVARVNAERRIQNKEQFIQFINIYYSCATIIFSILSYARNDNSLSLMSIFMTISLLITIIYLSSQKYPELARGYRTNYTQLQELEFELNHLSENEEEKVIEIENKYCKLMDIYSNHITFDFYCTIAGANIEFKNAKNWSNMQFKYMWGKVWRFILKTFLVLLPLILYVMKGII